MNHARQVAETLSDNEGTYRLFGLPGGTYFVVADAKLGAGQAISRESPEVLNTARQIAGGVNRPLPNDASQSTLSYLITYFPGVINAAEAQQVALAEGEELAGVDFTVRLGPTSIIAGVVTGGSDPLGAIQLSIDSSHRAIVSFPPGVMTVDRKFYTRSLPPGSYRIVGRVDTRLWASENIIVNGRDLMDVSLLFKPTSQLRGQVSREGQASAATPASLEGLVVSLRRIDVDHPFAGFDSRSTTTNSGGAFVLTGLVPGAYEVSVSVPARLRDTWWLKSIFVQEHDVLGSFLEIGKTTEGLPLSIVLTSKPSELAGRVVSTDGMSVSDYLVVVMSSDQSQWSPTSRRLARVYPLPDGTFSVKGLPTGEYIVGLVGTNSEDEVDRKLLSEVANAGVRVNLVDGQLQRIELRVPKISNSRN